MHFFFFYDNRFPLAQTAKYLYPFRFPLCPYPTQNTVSDNQT